MKPTHAIAAIILLFLSACQIAPLTYDNPRSVPPPGSVIELNQALEFSPGSSRSNIQGGEALGSSGKYNRFQPWCQFYLYESREAMKKPRTIEPDTFTVIGARQEIDYTLSRPVDVASLGIGGFGEGADVRPLTTIIRLKSDKQPQVHELRCSKTDDPQQLNFLSVDMIRTTLGDIATLHLPALAQ